MPYEITHDIYHVDEPEGYDAPQEAATELEMAEAKIEELEAKLEKAVEALGRLARLGNGDTYGNSEGNVIARTTLAELNHHSRNERTRR